MSYKSKPVFSPPIHQSGIFQDPEQINLKIKPILLSKYQYQNSNSFHQTSFRKNPTDSAAIHFANQYTNLSFFTNSKQTFATANTDQAPLVENSQITYHSIFPNTDLRYTIEPNRLLEEFVIQNQDTAMTMTEITQTLDRSQIDSYQEVSGAIELYKNQQLVATIPKPVMYEDSNQTIRSYDLAYTIQELDKNTLTITKVIDTKGQAWLTDPARTYPIVIDLVIDNADTSSSWVSSDATSTVVTQETTIKQEGTGSVKVATTAETSTTTDLMEYSSDSTAQAAYINESTINTVTATGGTITNVGGFRIHTFTSSGTFTPNGSMNVEVLVVAGGGGGSGSTWGGGGGGAGGTLYKASHAVSAGTTVTVGAGGAGGATGITGAHSYFGSLQAFGGGRAHTSQTASLRNGGSGGGAGHMNPAGAASATTQTSNNGGIGYGSNGGASSYGGSNPCGSGGGASAAGTTGGTGGIGKAFSITGSSVYYAGGGGQADGASATAGGTGGGGAGNYSGNGSNGTANKGGGGGGSRLGLGGSGGSGVVIIRYPLDNSLPLGGIVSTDGNYRIHKFTAGIDLFYNPNGTIDTEVLVVAGGGGGSGSAWGGGGAGAGGILYKANHALSASTTTVTIGTGGSASIAGTHSYFGSLQAFGGGRGYTSQTASLRNGGSGGGAGHMNPGGAVSSSTQTSNNGGIGYGSGGGASVYSSPYYCGSGGGAGAAGTTGGAGGIGKAFSISGSSTYYAGGGGQSSSTAGATAGGTGGGGAGNYTGNGGNGTANTGGGGGGSKSGTGGSGGSGVVFTRYLKPMQSYSESSIKTQGSYSLKSIATTASLNKTLTRTISPTLNLTGHHTLNFDLRSSRTGSNIKVGIHDSGGTTTEITPNITSADNFQTIEWDISGISDANKDDIDQIIITIVNASATNTFYIDNITATGSSLNNTVTLTKSATDLTGATVSYWVRSDTTGSFARFEFGETTSGEQTNSFTINSANTWEQKIWDLSSIASGDRDAVTKFAFKFTSDTSGAILYFDNINAGDPPPTPTPLPPTPTPLPTPIPMDILNGESNGANSCHLEESPQDNQIIIHWTDGATDEIGYEIEKLVHGDTNWQTIDITSPNAESYSDNNVSSGNIYRYRVRKRTDDGGTGEWCGTPLISLQTGNSQLEGLQLEGIKLD